MTLAPVSPSFAPLGDGIHILAQIATPGGNGAFGLYDLAGPAGALSFPTRPVKAGEVITLWGIGFGPTNPSVPGGKPVAAAAPVADNVTITIGGVPANPAFAGITLAGLYQINLTVPSTGSGDQPVIARVAGMATPALMLTVQ